MKQKRQFAKKTNYKTAFNPLCSFSKLDYFRYLDYLDILLKKLTLIKKIRFWNSAIYFMTLVKQQELMHPLFVSYEYCAFFWSSDKQIRVLSIVWAHQPTTTCLSLFFLVN